jgi:CheY-like chemotaxis protein
MNQQVICEHLARVGLKTIVAENGKIGVEIMKNRVAQNERLFDLIFMDIHMPVMDGIEATSKIMALKTGIPIIALTANIMSDDKKFYTESGMNDCMGKPFKSQELWMCLTKYIKPVGTVKDDEDLHKKAENELQQKLINYFVENNKTKYVEIAEALKTSDIKTAHRLAHTLKSNAGQLKKSGLQHAAQEVESGLRKNGEYINTVSAEQLNALNMELSLVFSELTPMVTKIDISVTSTTMDYLDALNILNDLEHVLTDSDVKCLSYIDKLKEISGSGTIIQNINDLNYELALEALYELKDELENFGGDVI